MNSEKKELNKQILEIKKEMKRDSVRVVSCFNGGLTSEERRFNTELFRLKTKLSQLEL